MDSFPMICEYLQLLYRNTQMLCQSSRDHLFRSKNVQMMGFLTDSEIVSYMNRR